MAEEQQPKPSSTMPSTQTKKLSATSENATVWLGWLAAVLYNSWPLGFYLNPSVLHHDVASDLAKSGQPYNWVFMLGDVLTGLVLLLVAFLQWRRTRVRTARAAILAYAVFGITTALAAVIPLRCDYSSGQCVQHLLSPSVIFHAGLSLISLAFLTLAILLAVILARGNKAPRQLLKASVIAAIAMPVLGIGGLVEIVGRTSNNSLPSYFISACAVAIGLVVQIISHVSQTVR